MPFQLRAIDEGTILLVRALGEASAEDWFGLEDRLPDALSTPCGLLIDLRPRDDLPTAQVARSIGYRFDTNRFAAVALVAREGAQFGLARSVDILAGDDTRPLRTFTELHEAAAWLRGLVDAAWEERDKSRDQESGDLPPQ